MNRYTLRVFTLIVVSVLVAILLASALNGFTRVADNALADIAPTATPRTHAPSAPTPGKKYLPIILLNAPSLGCLSAGTGITIGDPCGTPDGKYSGVAWFDVVGGLFDP